MNINRIEQTGAAPVEERASQKYGQDALTEAERAMLTWDPATELAVFQKLNKGVDPEVLSDKIKYFRNHAAGSEFYDFMKTLPNPRLSWEKIRDIYFGDTEDEETVEQDSHFGRHDLDEIKFPEGYMKAWIESVRQNYLDLLKHQGK